MSHCVADRAAEPGFAPLAAVTLGVKSARLALALVAYATVASAGQARDDDAAPDATPAADGLTYELSITGEVEEPLAELLEGASQLAALKDRPPATLAGLRRRSEDDLARFRDVLRSEGFYAGSLRQSIDETASPLLVSIAVTPGPLYLLADYAVVYQGAPPPEPDPAADLETLGLRIGMPGRAPPVAEAQRILLRALANGGYPLARVLDRRALVDHAETTLSVTLTVDAGPRATFGPVAVEGLTSVAEDYVRLLLPWQEGDLYDRRQVEAARLALSDTALFSSIRFRTADAPLDDGRLPMTLALAEREKRSIGAGVSFSTGEGPGGEAFWEHRNLLGANERLRLSLAAAFIEQSLSASFRKPRFRRLDQALLADAAVTRSDTDAFQEESARGFVGLERRLSEVWTVSGGLSAEFSLLTDEGEDEDEEDNEEAFLLYGLPLTAARDSRDDLLNATRGTTLSLGLTPYIGTVEDNIAFLVSELGGSAFYAVDSEGRIVLAGRARLGTIVGEETASVPASKRFYSGGGGSVRGYEFQSIGPLDAEDDPEGGHSVAEIGAEVRLRVTESIGLVPFVEGGIVGDEPFVDFSEDFLWAAGLGLRYYTAIGPLRLDVGFPINGRDRDDTFQFYVSLGQAF